MKILNKVSDLYYNIQRRNKSYLLYRLFELPYKIKFKINRFICYLFGCNVKGGHVGYNPATEGYSYYCKKCGASESNYQRDSGYKFLVGIFKRR